MKLDLNTKIPKPKDPDFPKIDIKPWSDRVIVLPFKTEEKSKGGIIIPDTAKEKLNKGMVIAFGPGSDPQNDRRQMADLYRGMIVTYGKYSGSDYECGDEEFLIMRITDITGEKVNLY